MKVLFASLLVLVAAAAFGQHVLPAAGGSVQVDGNRGPNEYSYISNQGNMDLALRRMEGNRLAFHYRVRNEGWIAIGLGSLRMNGAHILIGYYNNRQVIEEHSGIFHLHRRTNNTVLIESVLREEGDFTVWEGILDAGRFLQGVSLQLILAYGDRKNFTTKHRAYRSLELNLD